MKLKDTCQDIEQKFHTPEKNEKEKKEFSCQYDD